jgi:hypothetical protein
MAVTEASKRWRRKLWQKVNPLALLTVLLTASAVFGRADDAADARAQLSSVATALSAGNASDAMRAFDKSYPQYETLSNYFGGLANAFQITNEIDVTDERDTPAEIKLAVHWALTLQDSQTNYTENRAADIGVRLIKQRGKWKIAGFNPINIFDPQQDRFLKR